MTGIDMIGGTTSWSPLHSESRGGNIVLKNREKIKGFLPFDKIYRRV